MRKFFASYSVRAQQAKFKFEILYLSTVFYLPVLSREMPCHTPARAVQGWAGTHEAWYFLREEEREGDNKLSPVLSLSYTRVSKSSLWAG